MKDAPAIKNIFERRSVRKFQDKPVPEELLQQILDAGNAAPSGCNAQAWRFVVIEDAALRKRLAQSALPGYRNWMEKVASPELREMRREFDKTVSDPVYYSAPVVVFVIGWGMTADFDTPMVCQNMMLAAHALGLGSCWVYLGQFALGDQEVRKALELKPEEKVYGPIILGYPKDGYPEPPPKKAPQVKHI